MKNVSTLQTIPEWDQCKQEIPKLGLIILKFSPRCPISRRAERDFDAWCEQLAGETTLLCAKVNVVESGDLSQHLARELHVRHESPQAIWLSPQQQVLWQESHYSITPKALNTQLKNIQERR